MEQRKHRSAIRALVAVAVVVTLIGSGGLAHAQDDKPLPAQGPNPFPVGSAADTAASVIGEMGLTTFRDTFSGLNVAGKEGRLTVYATDLARAEQLVAAGRAALSDKDRSAVTIDVVQAPHTRTELIAAIGEVWKQPSSPGVEVQSVAISMDAKGLTVRVNDVARAQQAFVASRSTPGPLKDVNLTFEKGARVVDTSRDNDSAPYWGGTPVKKDGGSTGSHRCTSAFGMVVASGQEYLMTADHCFVLNELVEEPNQDDIGYTRIRNSFDDAEGIATSAGGAIFLNDGSTDVFDRGGYSWTGQFVCQSGYTSRPYAICGIQVATDYAEWTTEGVRRRGVYGRVGDGYIAVRKGDSGGPVWSYTSDGAFESRGINSAGSEELQPSAFEWLYWTETPHILSDFGGSIITTSY
jgi:hypothetical protein